MEWGDMGKTWDDMGITWEDDMAGGMCNGLDGWVKGEGNRG